MERKRAAHSKRTDLSGAALGNRCARFRTFLIRLTPDSCGALFRGSCSQPHALCLPIDSPITVSYFGGRGSEKAGFSALHSLFYLLGLAVINSTLGVAAALTGGLLGSVLQHPVVLITVAAILMGLALSFFGLWELKLPVFVTRAASRSYSGYGGSLFMGLTLGVVAAPCIGPFLMGLLTCVTRIGNPYLGFAVFFTLSLGLGIPLATLVFFS